MATDDDRPEPTVKELLAGDPATQRDLERWFGLPSFTELADRGVPAPEPEDDPELVAMRERRAAAIAAVDRVILERIERRFLVEPEALFRFQPKIDVRVKLDMALFDPRMVEQLAAAPREVEVSEALREDMKDVAPQALLRDLHRSEESFDKTFEIIDMAAEQRLDIVAEVGSAMATSWRLPPFEVRPFEEQRRLLKADRETRRRPWLEIRMPNRRVTE